MPQQMVKYTKTTREYAQKHHQALIKLEIDLSHLTPPKSGAWEARRKGVTTCVSPEFAEKIFQLIEQEFDRQNTEEDLSDSPSCRPVRFAYDGPSNVRIVRRGNP